MSEILNTIEKPMLFSFGCLTLPVLYVETLGLDLLALLGAPPVGVLREGVPSSAWQ